MSVTRLKRMVPLAAVVASSLVLAACASSSPSTTVDTHAHGVPYVTQSGSGDRTISSVSLPSTWSLVWKFSCTDPTTRRSFVVAVSADGRPPTTVTDQTGLEGGGYHPFTKAGDYTFTVTTSCSWNLLVATAGTETFPVTAHTSAT
jgi:hypothetical protein